MNRITKNFTALALLTAAAFAPRQADAQVAVDVDITVGSIVILYYHNDINVNIPDAALASLFTPAGCAADPLVPGIGCVTPGPVVTDATFAAGALNWIGAVTGLPAPTNLAAVDLNLQNVWAVRAIGGPTANTVVTVASGPGATITGTVGSIVTSGPSIDVGTTACDVALTTATFADPGLGTAVTGSVCLSLDFTNAQRGPFIGTAATGDSVYTLQVTGT